MFFFNDILFLPINITIPPSAPELNRTAAHPFTEYFSEIAAASQTAGLADPGDRFLRFYQHMAGLLQAVADNIFHRCQVHAFPEHAVRFSFTDKGGSCQFGHCQPFPVMLMHISEHGFYFITGFILYLLLFQHWPGSIQQMAPYIRQRFPQAYFITEILL